MAATVRAFKGLLTKRSRSAQDWLDENAILVTQVLEGASTQPTCSNEIRLALKTCANYIDLLESSMTKLANAYDSLEETSEEDDKQLDGYMGTVQDTIMKLQSHKSRLEKALSTSDPHEIPRPTTGPTSSSLAASKLPQIPIPVFSGQRWDWDNFWTLFQANVHDQDLTELQKFNYLLSSLKGEARRSIARFHVTPSNYAKAIAHLQKRYGDKNGIITELNRSIDSCISKGTSTSEQRFLLERLSALASQLKEHGEHMDNHLTTQIFLRKFHERIQKAVMKKWIQSKGIEGEWDLNRWLEAIDEVITQEEVLKTLFSTKSETEKRIPSKGKETFSTANKGAADCERCGLAGHKWTFCPKIPTPQARKAFLVETNRCLNCASTKHRAAACSSGSCRKCAGRHHTAICLQKADSTPQREVHSAPTRTSKPQGEQRAKLTAPNRTSTTRTQRPQRPVQQHAITTEAGEANPIQESETVVMHVAETGGDPVHRQKVILLAGSVRVLSPEGELQSVIVMLDTGSELSFINEHLAKELELPIVEKTSLMISTFGSPTPTLKECPITVLKIYDIEGVQHKVHLHRNDFLTSTIAQADLDQSDLDFIEKQKITLSIPTKQHLLQPQIILGCDYLWNFIMPIGRLLLPSGLHLIPTKFGYIISGHQPVTGPKATQSYNVLRGDSEKEQWDRYWTLESSGTDEFTGSLKTESQMIDEKILKDFESTIEKREDGYYVKLPWKQPQIKLPDNKSLALKRLEKTLSMHDDHVLKQYDDIFREQHEKGIIEEVAEDNAEDNIIHYLPHQAVITPQKETTKMRIVFDASAHYKHAPSLNEALHQGPSLLPDLVGILLRFRIPPIAVTADVEKAFLQVRIQERDRDATRCLWVRDISLPPTPNNIVIYRFTRVTFGLNSSPFLLNATIRFHLKQLGLSSKMAEEINRNLYVDNLLYEARDLQDALQKYSEAKKIFNGLSMNLREFMSNSETFNRSINHKDLSKNLRPKVLGMPWNTETDKLMLKGTMTPVKQCTKRTVSQQLSSIFDPLGLLIPLLLPAKVFLQSLWKDDFGWDNPLPPRLQDQWRILSGQMSTFYKELDRRIWREDTPKQLFAFSDASQFAMAACLYSSSGKDSHLLMAKSKLPSIKASITVPKMELNALILSARISHFVCKALELYNITEVIFFTDSEIVLGWLKSPPSRRTAGVLVWNRLKEMERIAQDLESRGIRCQFGHISTKDNPADCGSRGIAADVLMNHFWWKGPQLIREFDTLRNKIHLFQIPDMKESEISSPAIVASLMSKQEIDRDKETLFNLSRASTLYKAQRIVSYVLRFIYRSLRGLAASRKEQILQSLNALDTVASSHELTGKELRTAKKCIILDHQTIFVTEHVIKSEKDLNIQKDSEGILRCYGRLLHADLSTPSKTPIYIAPKTALARLIIMDAHGHYHRGVSHTMAAVREKYWIPKLRQQVRVLLRKCVPCQKLNSLPYHYPDMEALPITRVQRTRPFEHIGLDYFGPITVSHSTEESSKTYGCIFTCRSTRLIHLELVEKMTTEAFLNALRRFFARRGVPTSITCDNASTFLLGEQILHDATKRAAEDTAVKEAFGKREIEWIHITPYAPWQGGFYERLIRSIKHSLYKALGKQTVSSDVLHTMLVEIEAVLNSRPLTYQEERWEQQPLLRPIDFLQNEIVLDYPIEHIGESDDATYHTPEEAKQLTTQREAEKALKSAVKLTDRFWELWSTQYLAGLREHHRLQVTDKRGTTTTPREGEVVLICDAIQPRNMWKIGRIVELHPNNLGTVREIVVELPNKTRVRRPVNKVVPLELERETTLPSSENDETELSTLNTRRRYELRKRKIVDYSERDNIERTESPDEGNSQPIRTRANLIRQIPLHILLLCTLITPSLASNDSKESHLLQCTSGGVILTQRVRQPYEICSEDHCLSYQHPQEKEVIRFPPQITLHEHVVKWKVSHNQEINILETTCPATPFCTQIDCTFCVATIANPECWPQTAILLAGVLCYLLVAALYCFFKVPIIIGNPILCVTRCTIRIGYLIITLTLATIARIIWKLGRKITGVQKRKRDRLWMEIAICAVVTSYVAEGCQQLDIYEHLTRYCRRGILGESCHVDTSEIVKINPFKQEACLRFIGNSSNLLEVRLIWRALDLICEKETITFTRSTKYGLLDSKRCPHAGSCTGDMCAAVNSTSMIRELHRANGFPGITGCVESCGGPGCDCFYPSSGCLFYRIYVVPNDEATYEVFQCARWKPTVYLEMTVSGNQKATTVRTFHVNPNLPEIVPPLTITLSSITIPPTPMLNSRFITGGTRTALLPATADLPLRCQTPEHARNMNCSLVEDCKCTPAEVKMLCDCKEFNLTTHMLNLKYRFPILRPNLEFHMQRRQLISRILHSPSAEFIVRVKDELRMVSVITDASCKIENTQLISCYNCAKGALASVVCKSSTPEEKAEIRCGDNGFTVKCSADGTKSELRFTWNRARFNVICSVQCGLSSQKFAITGTLRYTGSLYGSARRLVHGESELYSEVNLPDFGHVLDVFLRWSGTLLITIIIIVLALISTYVCTTSIVCYTLVKMSFRLVKLCTCMIFRGIWMFVCTLRRMSSRTIKSEEKLL